MAKSWANMSKDERSNYEGKKAYNKQHGLERYAEGGELEHKSDTYVPPSSANTNANNQNSSSSSSSSDNSYQNNFDKKWSEKSNKEKKASKQEYGNKQSWQDAKAKAQGYQNESDKKAKKKEAKGLSGLTSADHQARMDEEKTPLISSQQSGYATDRLYVGPEGGDKRYTAKEADDAGWTPGYYNNDYKYMPQTYDDPNSAEAIAGRQDYLRRRKDKSSKEYEVWNRLGASQQMYDPTVHTGYTDLSDWSNRLQNQDAEQTYRKELEQRGIEFNKPQNHTFDFNKGYYVPNTFARNQRASMYDNMFMRGGSDRERVGDRNDYVHRYYDPLNGIT